MGWNLLLNNGRIAFMNKNDESWYSEQKVPLCAFTTTSDFNFSLGKSV